MIFSLNLSPNLNQNPFPTVLAEAHNSVFDQSKPIINLSETTIDGDEELSIFITSHSFLGSGTDIDPYIIKNLNFTRSSNDYLSLFKLSNLNSNIIITNCLFQDQYIGLEISNLDKIIIQNSKFPLAKISCYKEIS